MLKRTYSRIFLLEDVPIQNILILTTFLKEQGFETPLTGVFCLPVPESLLDGIFLEHQASCAPYRMTLEIEEQSVRLELLLRGSGMMSCQCIGYGSPKLESTMMQYLEGVLWE